MTTYKGGIGVLDEGPLKGRKFIIPSIVYVEKGTLLGGVPEFSKACIVHHKFLPDGGCNECNVEAEEKEKRAKEIGL